MFRMEPVPCFDYILAHCYIGVYYFYHKNNKNVSFYKISYPFLFILTNVLIHP